MWDLWWTNWRWGRFPPITSVSPTDSHSTDCFTLIIYHPGLVQKISYWIESQPTSRNPAPISLSHHQWIASYRLGNSSPDRPNLIWSYIISYSTTIKTKEFWTLPFTDSSWIFCTIILVFRGNMCWCGSSGSFTESHLSQDIQQLVGRQVNM
jgi:hypothetical protein